MGKIKETFNSEVKNFIPKVMNSLIDLAVVGLAKSAGEKVFSSINEKLGREVIYGKTKRF